MESEADGEGAMRAADEGAGAAAVAVGAACGGQGDPGDPVDPGDPGDSGNPGVAGEAGGAAGGLVQIQWAAHAAGPRRDAGPGAGDAGPQALQWYPFAGAPVGRASRGWAGGGLWGGAAGGGA